MYSSSYWKIRPDISPIKKKKIIKGNNYKKLYIIQTISIIIFYAYNKYNNNTNIYKCQNQ